jgi:hypothetical protein
MGSKGQQVDVFFADYISRFLYANEVARYMAIELANFGIGLIPLIDHFRLLTSWLENFYLSVLWSSITGGPRYIENLDIPVYL